MQCIFPPRTEILAFVVLLVGGSVFGQNASQPTESDASKFVYADFQDLQTGRPVSKHGGMTRLNYYSKNPVNAPQFRGLENANPPAPALVPVTADDTAAAFEYELRIPNEWAGVQIEVFGRPEKDGKLVPDDLSGYKFITLQIFIKGPEFIRVELISRGQGIDLESGYPSSRFRVSPGFITYQLRLDSFTQSDWARPLDLKRDVLKKLTSVTIGVHCEKKCTMEKGTVVVDNIAFEK